MHDHQRLSIIDSALWTDKVFLLARNMGIQLPEDDRDQGVPGRFQASHAEVKLIAFYMDVAISHIGLLQSWAGTLQWDTRVLDIDISGKPCDTCQVFAREIYERYKVIINFTTQGRICYPKCKNALCKQEMSDGSRIFCYVCQGQLVSLNMTRLDLPRRTAIDFNKVAGTAKAELSVCHQAQSLLNHLIYATCQHVSLGLYLYDEDSLAKCDLTIIVQPLTAIAIEDIVQDCLDVVCDWDEDVCLDCARRAMFGFVHQLHIPTLSEAFGDFDSFHWREPATPCPISEDMTSSFLPLHEIADALSRLPVLGSAPHR